MSDFFKEMVDKIFEITLVGYDEHIQFLSIAQHIIVNWGLDLNELQFKKLFAIAWGYSYHEENVEIEKYAYEILWNDAGQKLKLVKDMNIEKITTLKKLWELQDKLDDILGKNTSIFRSFL